ncbi:hypothetical protein ThrDRAFT_04534 [Frankia casuarinae]|uniref:Uncharacterized protein n=1 Tax=Frankia casuarinae (strain DSM 45818 / CECT 9043 / HFP020203 / CcI3) TaxID=106370 RepID=Q2JDR7_FRACC|nr:hypothetical protein [Frankia casuarinae]ABD10575.1 hypothetical protein Francci3_1197 [Frankia casuarinae]EYT89846.1 hypothetical protein ThrDRAFT_04534 [Frankia casuarinae]
MSIPALEHAAPPAGGVPVPAGYPAGDVAAALRWLAAEALRLHDLVVNAADAVPASAVGELGLTASDVRRLCEDRKWSTGRLIVELRRAAGRRGVRLPDNDSVKRTVRRWRNGHTAGLSPFYADLLSDVFGSAFTSRPPLQAVAR